MSSIRIKSSLKLSVEEVLEGISQLETAELEKFLNQVGSLLAKRKAPHVSRREAELLIKINKGISEAQQNRYRILSQKLEAETLTDIEHQEFLRLVDLVEEKDTQRLEYLIELARLRSVSLDSLIDQLELAPSPT